MVFSLIWIGSIIASAIIADRKKLNIIPFVFLSLFFGPLGLLIVALIPAKKSEASLNHINSIDDFICELSRIRDEFSRLQERFNNLENNFQHFLKQQQEFFKSESGEEVVFPEKGDASIGDGTVSHDYEEVVSVLKKKQRQKQEKESFEFVFGKYWLNRIGVIIFVLGVAFFISYTFKYLNAISKIAIGYLFSAAFLFWGNILEKKEKYTKLAWGILGGAWGLFYLSTYALHYIETTRIITSPVVALWLLAVVSLIAIGYNLKYKSWVVTSITYLLAFITAGLGGIEYSIIIYCAFLTTGIVYLSYKLDWHKFLTFGICGTYLTYLYWLHPRILSGFIVTEKFTVPVYQFQLCFGILTVSWVLFTMALFLLKPGDNNVKLKNLVACTLLNSGFYVLLALSELYKVRPHLDMSWDIRSWFLIVLAGLYFSFSYVYSLSKRRDLIVANCSVAFTLIAMAVMIQFSRLSIAFFWILEMMIIFTIGFYYKEKVYRILAAILGVFILLRLYIVDFDCSRSYTFLGIDLAHNILIFSFASLCFFTLGALTKVKKLKDIITSGEAGGYSLFVVFATLLITALLDKEVSSKWLTLAWGLQGIAILGGGFLLKHKVYRICGLSVLSLTCLRLVFVDMAGIETVYRIIACIFLGLVLLGASFVYSKFKARED